MPARLRHSFVASFQRNVQRENRRGQMLAESVACGTAQKLGEYQIVMGELRSRVPM
jgi:hypothetical protein